MTATTPEQLACPKCGTKQPPATACRRCGLATDRMAVFQPRDAAVVPELNTAWQDVEVAWGDASLHERFVALAVEHKAYAFAARRYRDALQSRPGDATATAYVEKIGKMVAVTLFVSATPKQAAMPKPYKNAIAIMIVLVVAIVIGLLYATMRGSTDADALAPPAQRR
jgi:hypothetical protein